MTLDRFGFALGVALLTAAPVAGCGDDAATPGDPDAAPSVDGAANDTSASDGGPEPDARDVDANDADARAKDAEGGMPDVDAGEPGRVTDLVATADTHSRVTLTWTAPPGDVWAYDVRQSAAPITTDQEFLAATPVPGPILLPPGSPQSVTVGPLTPETQYYFAIRVELAEGPFVLSNGAGATTKARAALMITEVATENTATEGTDFVELVATKAGSAADFEVHRGFNAIPLYRLGALDVAVGDRVVVHVGGLPGPAGFAQEDTTNDKTSSTASNASPSAFDVYSASRDLTSLAGAISLRDGQEILDAVAYSNRTVEMSDGVPSDPMIQGLLSWYQLGDQWVFSQPIITWGFDCPLLFDLVNSSGADVPACGGPPGHQMPGWSMQRDGATDTNSVADFFVAPQTPGTENQPRPTSPP